MRIPISSLVLALLLAAVAAPQPVRADDDDARDVRRALEGRRSGETMPFASLAQGVLDRYPGRVVEVELDDDDDKLVYEIKILQRNGRVLEVEVDARTGRILDVDEDD